MASNPGAPLTTTNIESNYGSTRRVKSNHRSHSLSVDSNSIDFIEPEWAKKWKAVAVISLFVGTVYLTTTGFSQNWYGMFEEWAATNQEMASIIIIVLFIPAALMFLPVDIPLYLIAGFMYGIWISFAICYIGYNIGSWVAFFFSKMFFREWFERKTRDVVYICAVRRAVKENALMLVLLFQLTPMMPYSMVNFFFGTSGCPFRTFAIGTAVGVWPMVLMFVFVGSTMKSIANAANGDHNVKSKTYWVLFWGGSFASFCAFCYTTYRAKKRLDALIEENLEHVDHERLSTEEGDYSLDGRLEGRRSQEMVDEEMATYPFPSPGNNSNKPPFQVEEMNPASNRNQNLTVKVSTDVTF